MKKLLLVLALLAVSNTSYADARTAPYTLADQNTGDIIFESQSIPLAKAHRYSFSFTGETGVTAQVLISGDCRNFQIESGTSLTVSGLTPDIISVINAHYGCAKLRVNTTSAAQAAQVVGIALVKEDL